MSNIDTVPKMIPGLPIALMRGIYASLDDCLYPSNTNTFMRICEKIGGLIDSNRTTSIIVGGHSRGGALAICFTGLLSWDEKNRDFKQKLLSKGCRVTVMTQAAPNIIAFGEYITYAAGQRKKSFHEGQLQALINEVTDDIHMWLHEDDLLAMSVLSLTNETEFSAAVQARRFEFIPMPCNRCSAVGCLRVSKVLSFVHGQIASSTRRHSRSRT